MEFSGTFELEDTTTDEVWLALSDPAMVWHALRGCELLVAVEDDDPDFDALMEEHGGEPPELTADPDVIAGRAFEEGGTYAAVIEASVGSVTQRFEAVGSIDEREEPRMTAAGEGGTGNSSFEADTWMELTETDDGGVAVEWGAQADVFGRLAQMGQRMINPVANRMTKQFFENLQDQLETLQAEAEADDAEAEASAAGEDGAAGAGSAEADEAAEADGAAEAAGAGGDAADPPSVEAADERGSRGGIVARIKAILGLG